MYVNNKLVNRPLGVVWVGCMSDILEKGREITDNSEKLIEITNYYVTISGALEDDDILRRYADTERIAFMKEKYNSCNILPGYNISYGKLLYDNNGVNQVEWAVNRLRQKPETKSATITMHVPGQSDLSCLSLLDFKMREGKLDMSAVYRSQNIFFSMPGNYIAMAGIQQYVADQLKVSVGVIEGIILSAHIYERDLRYAAEVVNKVREEDPDLLKDEG